SVQKSKEPAFSDSRMRSGVEMSPGSSHILLILPRSPFRPPRQLRAAINREGAAGNVVGLRINQEENTASNLFGPSHATPRKIGRGAPENFFGKKFPLAWSVGPAGI